MRVRVPPRASQIERRPFRDRQGIPLRRGSDLRLSVDPRWMRTRLHYARRLRLVASALAATMFFAVPSGASASPPITEFASGNAPGDIVAGPDGNLWFVEGSAIGRVTPAGTVTEFSSGLAGSGLSGIAVGPDREPLVRRERQRSDRTHHDGRDAGHHGVLDGDQQQQLTPGHRGGTQMGTSGSPSRAPTRSAGSRRPASSTSSQFLVATTFPWRSPPVRMETSGSPSTRRPAASGGSPPGRAPSSRNSVLRRATRGVSWRARMASMWFAGYANPGGIGRITTAGAILTPFTTGLTPNSVVPSTSRRVVTAISTSRKAQAAVRSGVSHRPVSSRSSRRA